MKTHWQRPWRRALARPLSCHRCKVGPKVGPLSCHASPCCLFGQSGRSLLASLRSGGHHDEAQQCYPEPALQKEVAVLREDMVQPARPESPPPHRWVPAALASGNGSSLQAKILCVRHLHCCFCTFKPRCGHQQRALHRLDVAAVQQPERQHLIARRWLPPTLSCGHDQLEQAGSVGAAGRRGSDVRRALLVAPQSICSGITQLPIRDILSC